MDRILRVKEVEKIVGMSSVTLKKLEENGNFPKRFHIVEGKRNVGWRESHIQDWIMQRSRKGKLNNSTTVERDIPLKDAMLCFNSVHTREHNEKWAKIIRHPARYNGHDWEDEPYSITVGACFSYWGKRDDIGRKIQLLIEAWHAAVFHGVPVKELHEAMLIVPEYRSMLAEDCLPKQFRPERSRPRAGV